MLLQSLVGVSRVGTVEQHEAVSWFEKLAEKGQIEEEIGEELKWKENPTTFWAILKNGWDLADEDQWPPALEWLHRSLELFDKVFAPRLDAVLQDSESE